MNENKTCPFCSLVLPVEARFCTTCGRRFVRSSSEKNRERETLNLRILYIMVSLLVLAILFPPWEAGPGESPAYLGMHFILSPPHPEALVSRMLQSIELVTIALGGMYLSWIFRERTQ